MPTVILNGRDTGVNSDDAREAFRRLEEAMRNVAEKADPDDDIIEVELPDSSDIDLEPEPEIEPDDFDFDETGYLAPGTDPDSIPPHLLPYVRVINNSNIKVVELERKLNKLTMENRRLSDFQNALISGNLRIRSRRSL